MTFETRQEVMRAAADWLDACAAAGITASCKRDGAIWEMKNCSFKTSPESYEFPVAILEGKEVWIGSEVYSSFFKSSFIVTGKKVGFSGNIFLCRGDSSFEDTYLSNCSWSRPKPKTVMVELLVEDAEWLTSFSGTGGHATSAGRACSEALRKLG